jgi:hypothetical protein
MVIVLAAWLTRQDLWVHRGETNGGSNEAGLPTGGSEVKSSLVGRWETVILAGGLRWRF